MDSNMQHFVMNMSIPQTLDVDMIEGIHGGGLISPPREISPKFIVMVMMYGKQQFALDHEVFTMDAGTVDDSSPKVLVLNLERSAQLKYVGCTDSEMKKIMVSAPSSWKTWLIDAQATTVPALKSFLSTHFSHFTLPASQEILRVAQQLISPPASMQGEVCTLYRGSRAFELMSIICSEIADRNAQHHRPQICHGRQSERVRDYILENLNTDLTIGEIARRCGGSVSSIQRHFKQHFGQTVFEFIRLKRLERARDALECEGASICQAAHIANYRSAPNFTTAFKKAFGVAPKFKRR